MEELNELLIFIQHKYNLLLSEWQNNKNYEKLNMKKLQVRDVYYDEKLLSYIFTYRDFLSDRFSAIMNELENLNINYEVNGRIKSLNSIQYKIKNYKTNHENGKILIKKCLNDLLGFRIIFNCDIDYNSVNNYVNANFPKLKCIKSERESYKAIHIYFGNDNNKNFQWELQLWDKQHEKSNLKSHAKYKQAYIKWEKEKIRGGV